MYVFPVDAIGARILDSGFGSEGFACRFPLRYDLPKNIGQMEGGDGGGNYASNIRKAWKSRELKILVSTQSLVSRDKKW